MSLEHLATVILDQPGLFEILPLSASVFLSLSLCVFISVFILTHFIQMYIPHIR